MQHAVLLPVRSAGRSGHAARQCSDKRDKEARQFPGPALGHLAGHCLRCNPCPAAVLPDEAQTSLLGLVPSVLQILLVCANHALKLESP